MSDGEFQKIQESDERMYGPKGILVCGYPPAEHRFFALFMDKAGFSDRPIIFPTTEDAGRTLNVLLGLTTGSGIGEPTDLPRAVIMFSLSLYSFVPVCLCHFVPESSRTDKTEFLT